MGSCPHIKEVRRWLYNFNRYLALSGFHKEIRRGDLNKVRAWANIILLFQKPNTLLKYIERIIFEETRDILLWFDLRKNELTLDQALVRITLSRKKWELSYLNKSSHFDNWHKGLIISDSRTDPLPLELSQILKTTQTPEEAYGLYFDIRKVKGLRTPLLEMINDLADHSKNLRLSTFLKFKPSSSYEFMVLLELYIGLYDIEAKERHQEPKLVDPFIPMEQKFYNDIHVSTGKALLRTNFWKGYSSRNFQFGELDLRFSVSTTPDGVDFPFLSDYFPD